MNFKSTTLLCILIATLFTSCIKSVENEPAQIPETLNLKQWYAENFLTQTQISSTTKEKSLNSKLNNKIKWNSGTTYSIEKNTVVIFEIDDSDIKFEENINASRSAVFLVKESGQTEFKILEIFGSEALSISDKLTAFANLSNLPSTSTTGLNKSYRSILYNSDYKNLRSKKTENTTVKKSLFRVIRKKIANTEKLGSIRGSNQVMTTNEICVPWGAFLVSYDINGNIESEELLYTYLVCTGGNPTEEESAPGYGGEGGFSEEEMMFLNYIQMEINSTSQNLGISPVGNNLISGVKVWKVAEGSFGTWSIIATTQYSYYHTAYTNTSTMMLIDEYDFVNYVTTGSAFQGTNIAIESIWTQMSVLDQVIEDDSPRARGVSRVSGSIKHRLRNPLPNNLGILDADMFVDGNQLTLFPK